MAAHSFHMAEITRSIRGLASNLRFLKLKFTG